MSLVFLIGTVLLHVLGILNVTVRIFVIICVVLAIIVIAVILAIVVILIIGLVASAGINR